MSGLQKEKEDAAAAAKSKKDAAGADTSSGSDKLDLDQYPDGTEFLYVSRARPDLHGLVGVFSQKRKRVHFNVSDTKQKREQTDVRIAIDAIPACKSLKWLSLLDFCKVHPE